MWPEVDWNNLEVKKWEKKRNDLVSIFDYYVIEAYGKLYIYIDVEKLEAGALRYG